MEACCCQGQKYIKEKGSQQIKGRRYISGKVLGNYVVTEARGEVSLRHVRSESLMMQKDEMQWD